MRSSKSTCTCPGACSGRFQLWCGSMSSGRMIFGSADFFVWAIGFYPWTTPLRNAKYATRSLPQYTGTLLRDERRIASARSRRIKAARCPRPRLIGLDSRSLDEPGVRLEFLLDHGLELGQRHGQGIHAQLEKLFAHIGRVHRGVELLVQPQDDFARRFCRDQRADPEVVVGVRIARLDGGGHVGKERAPLGRAHCERAELPFLDLRSDLEREREIEIGATREHFG